MIKRKLLPLILLFVVTLLGNATELKRDGWNLVSVCQNINKADMNMEGIEEIQNQNGLSIYTGDYAEYSNLELLEAGYGYWVKSTNGVDFDGGESNKGFMKPLTRKGWNLMGVCQDLNSSDLNMTNFKEIQSQDGKTIYTGDFKEYSNLEMLVSGYGYWVNGDINTSWIAQDGLSLPTNFRYQAINNTGEVVEVINSRYVIKIFSDSNESADSQANHVGVVVKINGKSVPIMQIQNSYEGKQLVVGVYLNGELVGVSEEVLVNGNITIPVTIDSDVLNLLTHAEIKGNLSNAKVKIYRVEENGDKTLLFKELTGFNGSFNDHQDELDDNKFYVYEVSGGVDRFNSTENNGTIRAVAKGQLIKENEGINVSLLSEMAYVFMAKDLKYDFNATAIDSRLNEVATTLLDSDINGDGVVDVADLLVFNYQIDLSSLNRYRYKSSKIEEITLELYKNSQNYTNKVLSAIIESYGSYTKSVTISSDKTKAFVVGNGICILDISDLANITEIGKIDTSFYQISLSKDETKIYAMGYNKLEIYDVSDFANIIKVGSYRTETGGSRKLDIALSNDEKTIFMANASQGLLVIDVSDPTNPKKISSYSTGNRVSSVELSKDNSKAFITDSSKGMIVLDITDLSNLTQIGRYDNGVYMDDITLSDDESKAFVVEYYNGLTIVDISDPTNPTKLGQYDTQGNARGVALSEDESKAYIADNRNGLVVVDISDSSNPIKLFSMDIGATAYNVTALSNSSNLFISTDFGVLIIDASDRLTNSPKIAKYTNGSHSYTNTATLSNNGTKLYTNFGSKFVVADISNLLNPIELDYDYLDDWIYQIVLSKDNTKAYIAEDDKGLVIMDITDSSDIKEIGHYDTGYKNVYGVALSKDETKVYLANYSHGLVVIDITDKTNPIEIGQYNTDGYFSRVVLSEDETKAFVADSRNGLIVLDITDPTKPIEIGRYHTGNYDRSYTKSVVLSADETKAFVVDTYEGLVVIDITDSTNPTMMAKYEIAEIGKDIEEREINSNDEGGYIEETINDSVDSESVGYNTNGYSYRVTLSSDETKAFVADSLGGLVVIDISNLDNLKEIAHYPTNSSIVDVTLSLDETKAFVSNYYNGLEIIDLDMFSKIINRPTIIVPKTTQQTSTLATVTAPVGAKIILNGVDTGIVIPESHKADINLDTSGADGAKTFELKFINIAGVESDTTTVTVIKDSTPTLYSSAQKETNQNSVTIEITGEIGATIKVNGVDVGTIDSNGRKTITLDTSGADGDKTFDITLTGAYGTESNSLRVIVKKDTTPPAKPTLTETPTQTYRNYVEIEVNGEANTMVVVDNNDIKETNATGQSLIRLDTSGENGDKTFEIKLKDSLENESEALILTIKKESPPSDNGKDSDNDHIPDVIETIIGTDPNNSDENDNGVLDGLESEGSFGDQFFDKQWHIRSLGTVVNDSGVSTIEGNDLDVIDIYHKYMGYNGGNPIIVQVVDNGIDADHEDLVNNMDLSRSYHHSSSGDVVGDPSPTDEDNTHGTMVAGIMASEAFNGKGVRGIIPFAKIAGSNWLEKQSISALEKVWLTGDGANEIAVTNNSWGYPTDRMTSRSTSFENIAKQGTETLRDGKGRIYVKSAGNDRSRGGNSNLTYVANNRFVIAVSALKHDNTHASYSSPGGNLLISGYSGNYYSNSPTIGTTINMGKGGDQTWDADENKNYTYKMNGTSAAGPTVAGAIALVLEACPNLGWRDVKYLLAKHGKKVDSSNESWVENGAGLWHSSDYGYGLVNPKGMIADCNSSYVNLDDNKTVEASGTLNLALGDGQVATIGGLNIDENISIEWVELTVDSNHTRASDYRVELISPTGTTSRIVDPTKPSGAWMNGGFRFGCAGFIEERSKGEWKVKISDFDPTDEQLSGTIKSLKIKVYGH